MINCRERIKRLEDEVKHLLHVERWCWEHAMYRELEHVSQAIKELLGEIEKLKKTCKE